MRRSTANTLNMQIVSVQNRWLDYRSLHHGLARWRNKLCNSAAPIRRLRMATWPKLRFARRYSDSNAFFGRAPKNLSTNKIVFPALSP
jgi:hypothetical protein